MATIILTNEGATLGISTDGVMKFVPKPYKVEIVGGTLRITDFRTTNDILYSDVTSPTSANIADLADQIEAFLETGGGALPTGASTEATLANVLLEVEQPLQVDSAGAGVTYIGYAAAGTATSAASWGIKRFTETGLDVAVAWADGNKTKDNIWDNRASLSYS